MTTSHRWTAALALVAAASALTLAGCSAGDDGDEAAASDRGIDASQYVDGYDESQDDDRSFSSSSGTAAQAPAAPAPSSSELLEDDTFVEHGTSGYVDTRSDPESTFALDVDTGSFSVAKTLLSQGVRPPAASVTPPA